MVFVDEAYIEFSSGGLKSSLARLTENNENIVISRTFSKLYGMAGLRVGYAIAHPETIAQMKKTMTGAGGTPSVVCVEAARAALTDEAHKRSCLDLIAAARENTYAQMKKWNVEYCPSSTNFVFFKTDRFGDQDLVRSLAARNVLIRAYADFPGWARVSMGTPDDMEVFFTETAALLQ
jgi:histidinol-phosphate aminotransferase